MSSSKGVRAASNDARPVEAGGGWVRCTRKQGSDASVEGARYGEMAGGPAWGEWEGKMGPA
jgi:hypothetical protein